MLATSFFTESPKDPVARAPLQIITIYETSYGVQKGY